MGAMSVVAERHDKNGLHVNNGITKVMPWQKRLPMLVLLYGEEVWTRTRNDMLLEITEMRIAWRIKGVTIRDKLKKYGISRDFGAETSH